MSDGDSLVNSGVGGNMLDSAKTLLGHREVKKQEKYLYFMFAGLLSLTPVFISFASADVMAVIFKGYNYSFYCVMPQYVSIPFVLLFVKLYDKLNMSMTTKIFISYIGMIAGLICIPLYTFSVDEPTNFSKILIDFFLEFTMLMLIFLVTFIFANCLQTFAVSVASIYDEKWIGIYFQFQPFSNIIINVFKNIVDIAKLSNKADVIEFYNYE